MNTNTFIIHIKTEDVYKDIANDVEKIFDTSNYEVDRPLPSRKNKKVIGLMKDELGGQIMTEFVALRSKTYSCLMEDGNGDKKAKGTKKCVIKKIHEVILKSQQRFKSEAHNLYTYIQKKSIRLH